MKQIFRCDFCDKIGTAEEIMNHETTCSYNRLRRSCMTCKHSEKKVYNFVCKQGKEIPEGHHYRDCNMYVWDEIDHTHVNPIPFNNLFGGFFG